MDFVANAERGAAVARGRLHIDASKRRVQKNLAVHDRVVSNAARKTQIRQSCFCVQMIQNVKTNFFESQLQAGGDVALAIG